jgi:Na+/H+-translocating membrane pyrophosphatase
VLRIAFRTGGVVGMSTAGLGRLGACAVVLILKADAPKVLEEFGFGAALLAMVMRVGGGIFTKAADVGADLVGKVEQASPRTTRATPPPSRTTWAPTSAPARGRPQICSSPTPSPL